MLTNHTRMKTEFSPRSFNSERNNGENSQSLGFGEALLWFALAAVSLCFLTNGSL